MCNFENRGGRWKVFNSPFTTSMMSFIRLIIISCILSKTLPDCITTYSYILAGLVHSSSHIEMGVYVNIHNTVLRKILFSICLVGIISHITSKVKYCLRTKRKESWLCKLQYIPRNMHTVFALLCFVVVINWLIFPYPSGLLHWHCDNLTIAPVPAKQPWWIWINTSCEFIMNDCATTTKQSTTKRCAYFSGYTVVHVIRQATWQQWSITSLSNNICNDDCSMSAKFSIDGMWLL